jgi:hypothetical protein
MLGGLGGGFGEDVFAGVFGDVLEVVEVLEQASAVGGEAEQEEDGSEAFQRGGAFFD